jgi:hypothetical protein
MTITRQMVADRIAAYLRRQLTQAELVDWAENALMESEFAEKDAALISAVVARLGVADVREFGLAWSDCEDLLRQLGFKADIRVVAA